jgi:hypothetical protein
MPLAAGIKLYVSCLRAVLLLADYCCSASAQLQIIVKVSLCVHHQFMMPLSNSGTPMCHVYWLSMRSSNKYQDVQDSHIHPLLLFHLRRLLHPALCLLSVLTCDTSPYMFLPHLFHLLHPSFHLQLVLTRDARLLLLPTLKSLLWTQSSRHLLSSMLLPYAGLKYVYYLFTQFYHSMFCIMVKDLL